MHQAFLHSRWLTKFLQHWLLNYYFHAKVVENSHFWRRKSKYIFRNNKIIQSRNRNVKLTRITHKQDEQCTCKCNIEARSRNHSSSGRAISTAHSECVSLAIIIQHAMRMHRIMSSTVSCPALQYFSTLSHKRQYSRKSVTEHKMCFDLLCKFYLKIFSNKKNLARYYHNCTLVFT